MGTGHRRGLATTASVKGGGVDKGSIDRVARHPARGPYASGVGLRTLGPVKGKSASSFAGARRRGRSR
jgi:hypothetical protein